MWLSQLKFSIRILLKDKFFSVLNIFGLALGISISIILFLILQNDFTYDQHYANHDRIYRLGAHYQIPGNDEYIGSAARELAPILLQTYSEIETLVRIHTTKQRLVKEPGQGTAKSFYEDHVAQADSSYFDVFSHAFVAGDVATCLDGPGKVVITQSMARKYFDGSDPMNRTLSIDEQLCTVSGIISDFPENTHLKFDFLLSGLGETRPDWDVTMKDGKPISLLFWNPDVYLYMLLPANYEPQRFYARFKNIFDQYFREEGDQLHGSSVPVLQPLIDIHFSGFSDDGPAGNLTYLYAFSGIGFLIVLLACINYMNLSTAKAVNRATEITIRKIVGSGKRVLAFSALCESALLALISLVIGLILVPLALRIPMMQQIIGRNLHLDLLDNPWLLFACVGIALSVGLIAGIYPAFYLPSIPVLVAMKGKYKSSPSSYVLRKGLITGQFAISLFVVICTLFMIHQINFMQSMELGFDKDNVLVVPIQDVSQHKSLQAIKNELLKNPHITSVTASGSTMGLGIGGNVMFGESENGMQQQGGILGHFVGDDYLTTMGIPLLQGRDFRPGEGIDEHGMYIANEAVVKLMGWGNNALGKKVTFWGGENSGTVIGVVKDFHASSLHNKQEPMFIVKGHWGSGYQQIRLTGTDLPATIAYVKKVWSQYDTMHPFEYFFLDQRFNEQYNDDVMQSKLLGMLSYICIFICLLGLVGLSAFNAAQRIKEIGVRRVMGASVKDIILLMSGNTLGLVVLASVIALPLSWWTVSRWLDNFAYRTVLPYADFLWVTLAAMVLVFVTIAIQSLKAARANPTESLKYE
ncbi:MAG TPA: ABC transporter permease [Chryseolinea sp.]|nr:ABC transporter permease [Chryseolinea sp.]